MNIVLIITVVVTLIVINVVLWKFGFIHDSEKPQLVDDKPVMNPRQRKAILERLNRWKAEGKLSPAEYENVVRLCEDDWG